MNKGTRVIICIIAVIIIMIAERGVPVKFTKWDYLIYFLLLCSFISMSDSW